MFSLKSNGVEQSEFDFNFNLDIDYIEAESEKVIVEGIVTLKDGTQVPFTAPVPHVKLQFGPESKFKN